MENSTEGLELRVGISPTLFTTHDDVSWRSYAHEEECPTGDCH